MGRLLAALLALSLLFASCGGGNSSSGGLLLFGTAEGIVERAVEGDERRILIPETQSEAELTDPAISLDGSQIAYVRVPRVRRVQGALDPSGDVWVANRDGSGQRMVYERQQIAELASSPRWLDDSTVMFILRNLIDPARPTSGTRYRLMRLDINTGATATVVEQVISFDLSPDRTRLAYVAIESTAEQPLFLANVDGSAPQRRLDKATSGLDGFSAVTFAADGAAVYFMAHEETAGTGGSAPGVRAALLHGGPSDLWWVPVESGPPELIAELDVENAGLALGDDGLAFALSGALLQVHLDTGEVDELDDPQRFAGLAFDPD